MRGKQIDDVEEVIHRGNIPAYAGKTWRAIATSKRQAEHPRVCGENPLGAYRLLNADGTSPRMRGKPMAEGADYLLQRNIPAYAGKTW